MNKNLLLFVLFFSISLHAQKSIGEIALAKNVFLEWETEVFNPTKHNIVYCKTAVGTPYLCIIDGKPWFGSDHGQEMPRNQLNRLLIKIDSQIVALEVANMFNASFTGALSQEQFLFRKEGAYYKLYGYFSDGAGTYTVHWKIINETAVREVISNDENFFEWQSYKN